MRNNNSWFFSPGTNVSIEFSPSPRLFLTVLNGSLAWCVDSFSSDVNLEKFRFIDPQVLLENMQFDNAERQLHHINQLLYPNKLCVSLCTAMWKETLCWSTLRLKNLKLFKSPKTIQNVPQSAANAGHSLTVSYMDFTYCEKSKQLSLNGQQWLKKRPSSSNQQWISLRETRVSKWKILWSCHFRLPPFSILSFLKGDQLFKTGKTNPDRVIKLFLRQW